MGTNSASAGGECDSTSVVPTSDQSAYGITKNTRPSERAVSSSPCPRVSGGYTRWTPREGRSAEGGAAAPGVIAVASQRRVASHHGPVALITSRAVYACSLPFSRSRAVIVNSPFSVRRAVTGSLHVRIAAPCAAASRATAITRRASSITTSE